MDDTAWAQTRQRLLAFVSRRVSTTSSAAAEDVVQDVLAKMVASIDRLDDATKLDAWAYQIARYAIADEYRRRTRDASLLTSLGPPVQVTGDLPAQAAMAADRVELVGCLLPMVEALAEPYRQALTLTGLHGLTQAAAAAQVGVSVPAMKSRVQRARRKLGEQVQACCEIDVDDAGPHGHTRGVDSSAVPGCGCGCAVAVGQRDATSS